MRKKLVVNLKDTDKLAKTIYNENGHVLLKRGIEIRDNFKEKMAKLGLNHVYIEDDISSGIEIKDYLSEKIRITCKNYIRETFNNILLDRKEDFSKIIDCSEMILDDIMTNKNVLFNIEDSRFMNENIIPHMINVAALIAIAGKNLGYNYMKLKDIVVGAMLHDIGKIVILRELGWTLKDFNNIDDNLIKEHPKKGYELLNQLWVFSATSKVMILMHHENCDGSGFPMALKKNDINEAARLLKICDAIDNLINGESGFLKLIPYVHIIDELKKLDKIYDNELVGVFEKFMPRYPTGSIVKISTGDQAIVTKQNYTNLYKPIVRVFYDKSDTGYFEFKEIDLNENRNIVII